VNFWESFSMATFRVVWQFIDNNGSQWNEVYYRDASNALLASQTGFALAQARIALMHPLSKLLKIRSSQVDASRVTGATNFNWNGTYPDPNNAGPATAGDAIVCSLSAAPSGTRKIWMRGCADSAIQRQATSGEDYLSAGVKALLDAWFSALAANSYGLRTLKPQTPGPLQNNKIMNVDATGTTGTAAVTVQAAPLYVVGSRVIIGGCSKKDLPAINGRWTVLATAGNVVTIGYQTPQNSSVPGGNGYMRAEQYNPIAVFDPASCAFSHFGTRTTKNPITRSRGARRAVRLRSSL
jgi:hypothetical protein